MRGLADDNGDGSRRGVAGAMRRTRARLQRLGHDRRGVAALEFALTGVASLGLMLFVISLGFRLYAEVALDYAVSRAARLLAVDSTHSLPQNRANFQTTTFCPLLPALLSCVGTTLALVAVTDYRNASAGSAFSTGQGGNLMLLQVTYQLPALSWVTRTPTGGVSRMGFGPSVSASFPYQNEY